VGGAGSSAWGGVAAGSGPAGVVVGSSGLAGGLARPTTDSDRPTHYYGRVTLDSLRWTRSVTDIAEAIVDQLAKAPGAKVTITIEVEADANDGFDENVKRTVTENATVLKLDTSEFEDD